MLNKLSAWLKRKQESNRIDLMWDFVEKERKEKFELMISKRFSNKGVCN